MIRNYEPTKTLSIFYFFFLLIISQLCAQYESYDDFAKDYVENKKLFKYNWLFNPEGGHIPEQGWKIHVSCSIQNLTTIIPPVVDQLLVKKIQFKIPKDLEHINIIYKTSSQLGKIITIYSTDTKQAVETIAWVDKTLLLILQNNKITHPFPQGIQNPVELKVGESGFLLARYGKLEIKEEKVYGAHYIAESNGNEIMYEYASMQSSAETLLKVLDEKGNQLHVNDVPIWTLDDKKATYKPYFIKDEPFSKAGIKVIYPEREFKN